MTDMPTELTVISKPHMNRVYITGDVAAIAAIRSLLCDIQAKQDEPASYWLPIGMEPKLRAALVVEPAYQAKLAAEQADWDAALAVIPAGYRTRHGSLLGGTVAIDGERITEPALDTRRITWQFVAGHENRVRDLTGRSSINGQVMDSKILSVSAAPDGRPIYRVVLSSGFGDYLRVAYYLPADLWRQLMATEVRLRNITPAVAHEWLARYQGCVGTELYEFAADPPVLETPSPDSDPSQAAVSAPHPPCTLSLPGGTG